MRVAAGAALILALAGAAAAWAQAPLPGTPAEPNQPTPGGNAAAPAPEQQSGFWTRDTLLGDAGGVRSRLSAYGITLGLTETSEVLGNVTGGIRRGAIYEGATQMTLNVEKPFGIEGGRFYASAYQIHGRGLSASNLGNLNVVSGIEADPSTRLFELWYQQALPGGVFDIRAGQLAADQEFMLSQYAAAFLNASFGWPTLPAIDLPSGGPAYPLATPGVRLRARASEAVTVLLGLFNGSPAGLGPGDPQRRDASGTNFNLNGGAFVIAEVQCAASLRNLPGVYKLGAWYNSNVFQDQRVAASLVGASAGGGKRGDWSLYAVAEQALYRPQGAEEGGLGIFVRVMGAPGDRNLVNAFVDGGLSYQGAFGRPKDTIGLGLGWARISDRARAGDLAAGARPRSSEALVELTYQAQVAGWWQVQPDLQYIIRPGGGVADPLRPGGRVGNALVLGARTIVTF